MEFEAFFNDSSHMGNAIIWGKNPKGYFTGMALCPFADSVMGEREIIQKNKTNKNLAMRYDTAVLHLVLPTHCI